MGGGGRTGKGGEDGTQRHVLLSSPCPVGPHSGPEVTPIPPECVPEQSSENPQGPRCLEHYFNWAEMSYMCSCCISLTM